MRTGIITLGIVALTAVSVGGASAQETWQLAQVNGSSLPAVVEQDDDGCRDEVVAGTLTLDVDGTWSLETSEREVCGDRVEEDSETEDGRYTREASAIRFTDEDGDEEDSDDDADDGVDVEDFVSGTVEAAALTVRLDDGNTLTFRR